MGKGYENWTQEMADAHNRKVAEGKKYKLKTPNLPPTPPPITHYFQLKPKRRKGMNKTEARFFEILKLRHPGWRISFECVTLKLGDDCRYTVDFFVENGIPAIPICYEVKGKQVWDDSIVKLKTAATQYPCFKFIKAQLIDGHWKETEIFPK